MANSLFPQTIQAIGNEIAIIWNDGKEDYFPMSLLREKSPSAENTGETDLLGNRIGGPTGPQDHSNVTVTGWQIVGGYAVAFSFSDGHRTGLFGFDYLRAIAPDPDGPQPCKPCHDE
ncbi:DUF971 domain-containing protein [Sulfuriroseicoccus oceanibius]|uniref:DUF971 domain-containing protein n=2 Tax=Sulfuriroseicoccus oceanibius TaxID=2707525 RepID=A0A6B3LDN9_9BACT|nr:DUF971 domain-containing protein [Sulfuriroseicoccus oceanibius]